MPGYLTADQMAEARNAPGTAFDAVFVRLMSQPPRRRGQYGRCRIAVIEAIPGFVPWRTPYDTNSRRGRTDEPGPGNRGRATSDPQHVRQQP